VYDWYRKLISKCKYLGRRSIVVKGLEGEEGEAKTRGDSG
jgi:hypothetical protein